MAFNVSNHQVRKMNGVFVSESVEEVVQEMLKLGIQATMDLGLFVCDPDRGAIIEMHPHGWWNGGKIGMDAGGNIVQQDIVTFASPKAGTAFTAGTGVNLRTNTSGKKFYMTSLVVSNNIAAQTSTYIIDGSTTSGTVKWNWKNELNNGKEAFVFPTPIEFATGVFFDADGGTQAEISFTGWEQ